MWSNKCCTEGGNPFSQSMGYVSVHTAPEAVGLLCLQSTPLAHIQLTAHHHPGASSTELLPSPSSPSWWCCRGSSCHGAGPDISLCRVSRGSCCPIHSACLALPEQQLCPWVYWLVSQFGVTRKHGKSALCQPSTG